MAEIFFPSAKIICTLVSNNGDLSAVMEWIEPVSERLASQATDKTKQIFGGHAEQGDVRAIDLGWTQSSIRNCGSFGHVNRFGPSVFDRARDVCVLPCKAMRAFETPWFDHKFEQGVNYNEEF